MQCCPRACKQHWAEKIMSHIVLILFDQHFTFKILVQEDTNNLAQERVLCGDVWFVPCSCASCYFLEFKKIGVNTIILSTVRFYIGIFFITLNLALVKPLSSRKQNIH